MQHNQTINSDYKNDLFDLSQSLYWVCDHLKKRRYTLYGIVCLRIVICNISYKFERKNFNRELSL